MSTTKELDKFWDQLLYSYDFHIRGVERTQRYGGDDDYQCGTADAIGQVVLDLGKICGERHGKPYRHEAFKRVMNFTNAANYVKEYPMSVEFPREEEEK